MASGRAAPGLGGLARVRRRARRAVRGRHRPRHRDRPPDRRRADAGRAPSSWRSRTASTRCSPRSGCWPRSPRPARPQRHCWSCPSSRCSPSSPASATRGSRTASSSGVRTAAPRCSCATCSRRTTSTRATTPRTSSSCRCASPSAWASSEDVRRECELGAMLHDIGKISIPDAIINKPGPLDDAEWALMKTHTVEGQRMLDRVGGLLGSVGLVVRASHERFDGGGYPDGLAGEAIPLASRIVSACDAFNAMTTTRSYRKAMPVAAAVDELHRCSGTQFDPAVVTALVALVDESPGFVLTQSSRAVGVGEELRQRRQERGLELLGDRDDHAGDVDVVAVRVRVRRHGRAGEDEERRQREVVEPDELLGVDARGVEEFAQGGVVLGVALRDVGELLHASECVAFGGDAHRRSAPQRGPGGSRRHRHPRSHRHAGPPAGQAAHRRTTSSRPCSSTAPRRATTCSPSTSR